jgi:hypothetical protein
MALSPVLFTAIDKMEREILSRDAAARAEERQKKRLAAQKKAADRERDLQNKDNGMCYSF